MSIWAIVCLFHMATNRMFTIQLHFFLLSASAVYLLLKPSSVIRLIIFISLQLYEVFNALPVGSNHWIFAAFVNLTILRAIFYQVLKGRSFQIDKASLLETFAPIVRIELIILYFFVVFHKLNSGFFNPVASCASEFYVAQNAYSFLPTNDQVLAFNAYFTVLVEALIPILLCFRLTRNWGLLIGLIFHCLIAYNPINGFYDFSSVIFATYFLFTSDHFSNRIFRVYKSILNNRIHLKSQLPQFSYKKFFVFLMIFVGGVFVVHVLTTQFRDYFRHIIWTAFSFSFIAIFITSMRTPDTTASIDDSFFKIPHASFLLIPVLVFLNGACPYLGLKTESSFAMFSNLRIEDGITNHYLVPVGSQIFDYQKELIEITSSSDKVLNSYASKNKLLVYPHFQRIIARRRPKTVTYIHNGEEKYFELANAGSELIQPQSYWFRKFIRFRPISKEDPQPCVH
ncbi:hypothetical protein [Cesiribacter sp. SM1]|uniref:hypothetical protein n=1 Tax=Cesiribacter sp. SM1 TaxID=2861196 RepID=UPI001CD76575|nr:hypothetical protein [Cesiribacter sp. SM1]